MSEQEPEGMSREALFDAVNDETDLSRGAFIHRDYAGLNLEGAKFAHGDFTGTNFENACLDRADFTGAILKGVDFTGADLEETKLVDANLVDAIFDDVSDCDTNFTGAIGYAKGGMDDRGYHFYGIWSTKNGWMVKAGCRWYTLEQAREHWSDNDDAMERVNTIANTPAPKL